MKYTFFLLLLLLGIYLLRKKQFDAYLKSATDYFNPSRPWSEAEKRGISKTGTEQYRGKKAEMIKSGRWKFPAQDCANRLAKKYPWLKEWQVDQLAARGNWQQFQAGFYAMSGAQPYPATAITLSESECK